MTKLPDLATLKSEYARVEAEKERLYVQYGEAKKTLKEYGIIKQNVEQIIGRQIKPDKTKTVENKR